MHLGHLGTPAECFSICTNQPYAPDHILPSCSSLHPLPGPLQASFVDPLPEDCPHTTEQVIAHFFKYLKEYLQVGGWGGCAVAVCCIPAGGGADWRVSGACGGWWMLQGTGGAAYLQVWGNCGDVCSGVAGWWGWGRVGRGRHCIWQHARKADVPCLSSAEPPASTAAALGWQMYT